jgi:hypothetical protein
LSRTGMKHSVATARPIKTPAMVLFIRVFNG